MKVEEQVFDVFNVYSCEEYNSFLHIDIHNSDAFYQKMFDYFFDESRLLRYTENTTCFSFVPSKANYATLYKKLQIFIDKENDYIAKTDLDKDILDVFLDEYTIETKKDKQVIRLDKIGKIGEYIFSNILSDFFGFNCIVPKLNLVTDNNMNVFGIDTLFYDPKEKLLLLGESKVSKSLDNGIALINKSLSTYQQQADEEFVLILSQRWLKQYKNSFVTDFGDSVESALTMSDFISNAGIESIGIPIFIAHGQEKTVEEIFDKLREIKKVQLYNINTRYFSISLPIIEKDKFISIFTESIAKRRELYESKVHNQ